MAIYGKDNEIQIFGQLEAIGDNLNRIKFINTKINRDGLYGANAKLEYIIFSEGSFLIHIVNLEIYL